MIAVGVILLTGLLALGLGWLQSEFRIDRCLDGGGRWNYAHGGCEHE